MLEEGAAGLSREVLFNGFWDDDSDYVRDLFIEFRIILESKEIKFFFDWGTILSILFTHLLFLLIISNP